MVSLSARMRRASPTHSRLPPATVKPGSNALNSGLLNIPRIATLGQAGYANITDAQAEHCRVAHKRRRKPRAEMSRTCEMRRLRITTRIC